MTITAKELKLDIEKYLSLAATEDVFITNNGEVVAVLSNPNKKDIDAAKSLIGVLSKDFSLEETKKERLDKIENM